MASNPIDCIKLHAKYLSTDENISREAATDLALKEFEKLHGELETFKKLINPKYTKQAYVSPDKSARIKEIQDEYQAKIDEANTPIPEPVKAEEKPLPEKPIIEDKPTAEKEPPIEPPKQPSEPTVDDSEEGRKKAFVNRIVNAENVSEGTKELIKKEGLKYKPKNQKEAVEVAKAIIDTFGLEKAISMAESLGNDIDGDVRTFIFTESLNQLQGDENAKQFAKVSITLDKFLRNSGRSIAAVGYFYKNNPFGIVMAEETVLKEAFYDWLKRVNSDKSYDDAWKEIISIEGFDEIRKNEISEAAKKERAEERKERKAKVHKSIDEALDKWNKKLSISNKDDVTGLGVSGQDAIFKAIGATMKAAYDAGEAIATIISDAVKTISEKLGNEDWGTEEFKDDWTKILSKGETKNALTRYKDSLRKQIERLKKELETGVKYETKRKERGYDDEVEALMKERDDLINELKEKNKKEKTKKTDEEKISDKEKSLEEKIKDLNKQIVEKRRNVINKKEKVTSDKIKELEETIKQKQKELEKVAPISQTQEYKLKQLDKIREKLKGLNNNQKDAVITKLFYQIIQNGGLSEPDFIEIIREHTGLKQLTEVEKEKMESLTEKMNSVQDYIKKVQEDRSVTSLTNLKKAELEASYAMRELNELRYSRPKNIALFTQLVQLSTLTGVSLVVNPVYNIMNQSMVRFPVGIFNTITDAILYKANKLLGKEYRKEFSTVLQQQTFWKNMFGGLAESMRQFKTGLSRQDYNQKELYGQSIRPYRAFKDILAHRRSEKHLTQEQLFNKSVQSTLGIWAEGVARTLNLGDKPQRFGAGGALAATFSDALGIPKNSIDKLIFETIPQEETFRIYKEKYLADGMSNEKAEEEASIQAEYVKKAISQEGARSTFQQDNILNTILSNIFSGAVLGGNLNPQQKDKFSQVGGLVKTFTISPYLKIPANAYWSYFNIKHPEVALLQSAYHFTKSASYKKNGDKLSSMLANREARYWLGHAAAGFAMRAFVMSAVSAGVFVPSNDPDKDKKRERQGEEMYEKPGTINITKLWRWLTFRSTDVEGGTVMDIKWWGQFGSLGNSIAREMEGLTKEQKENRTNLLNTLIGGLDDQIISDLQQGIFSSGSSMYNAITNGGYFFDKWSIDMINMGFNIVHPAAFAQLERAGIKYQIDRRGDSWGEKFKNSMLERSGILREITGQDPPRKVSVFGEDIIKQGGIFTRVLGINNANEAAFASDVYDDYKRTGDVRFLPPAINPVLDGKKLNTEQSRDLERFIGQSLKEILQAYIEDGELLPESNITYQLLQHDSNKINVLNKLYQSARTIGVTKFLEKYKDAGFNEEKIIGIEEENEAELFKDLNKGLKDREEIKNTQQW